ncbi:hypothetical protein KKG45_13705 [bacterium]|nr:hypothetical protein [bacterium]MBU1074296.1 hypothetical protein [bacterium]MBU1674607.1 hypothetical protein [bacterium]
MATSNTFLFLAILSVAWGVATSLRITAWLQKRGVKINYVFIRMMIIRYVHQYREMSRTEFGHAGPLFYNYVIAMNIALVCAVIGLALR